jgi:hypothetical protein
LSKAYLYRGLELSFFSFPLLTILFVAEAVRVLISSGAQVQEVGEPTFAFKSTLFRSQVLFKAEFDFVAEPKALSAEDLRSLVKKMGSSAKVARFLGTSVSFVLQNAQKKNYKNKRRSRGT